MPEREPGNDRWSSLRHISLFSGVSDGDLKAIADHLIERQFPRNATIVEEGLPGDYMYVIREGRVKVTKLSEDGREKILQFLETGDFFGEMALLDSGPRSASVKTLADVRLLALSRNAFLGVLSSHPSIAMVVIRELARRLREADTQASAQSFQCVEDRTRGLLGRLAREPRGERLATPPLTHQQIADMIGTSRETVTRVIQRLKREGGVAQEGKHYLVPSED